MPGENRGGYCRDRAKTTATLMMERKKFDDGVQLVEESRRLIKICRRLMALNATHIAKSQETIAKSRRTIATLAERREE
jgi:hypothetical protein